MFEAGQGDEATWSPNFFPFAQLFGGATWFNKKNNRLARACIGTDGTCIPAPWTIDLLASLWLAPDLRAAPRRRTPTSRPFLILVVSLTLRYHFPFAWPFNPKIFSDSVCWVFTIIRYVRKLNNLLRSQLRTCSPSVRSTIFSPSPRSSHPTSLPSQNKAITFIFGPVPAVRNE